MRALVTGATGFVAQTSFVTCYASATTDIEDGLRRILSLRVDDLAVHDGDRISAQSSILRE
jgi:hypothetical protein